MLAQLVTSKGRAITFGPHVVPRLGPMRPWSRIFRLPETRSSRIFFNAIPAGITRMASDAPQSHPAGRISHKPQIPISQAPSWMIQSWGYYTSAAFENVAQVIPCRLRLAKYSKIIGLLLQYSDGSRECVGQCRFDSLTSPLQTQDAPKLCLAFDRRKGQFHHVATVELCPPRDRMSLDWLDLPWGGRLEWWVGPRQDLIHHQGQQSPCRLG